MAQVVVDEDWQIQIPAEIRREANVEVGQTLAIVAKGGVISLVPRSGAAQLLGLARGESPTGYREKKDRDP